ncbi:MULTISPECIES: hypothetical protein [unclassified Microcoleus]|nr:MULTISPECIES: hypothetical protein [unclassified Microcoleus]
MNSLILISPDRGEAFNQFFLIKKISLIPEGETQIGCPNKILR